MSGLESAHWAAFGWEIDAIYERVLATTSSRFPSIDNKHLAMLMILDDEICDQRREEATYGNAIHLASLSYARDRVVKEAVAKETAYDMTDRRD